MRMSFAIGDRAVSVVWEAEEVSAVMENMFHPWRVPDAGDGDTLIIEEEPDGYLLHAPGIDSFHVEGAFLVSAIEMAVTDMAFRLLKDSLLIHAALIDFRGTGVMIPGPHGSGKTTLALAALSSGFTALTDEVAVIGSDNRTVYGFPRPFRVGKGARAIKPPVVPPDCPRSESPDGIMHVHFSAPGLPYYTPDTRIERLVFPARKAGETKLRPIGEREALVRILPQGFNCHLAGDGRLSDLLDLIRHTRPMEILYSDPWSAAHTIKEAILSG